MYGAYAKNRELVLRNQSKQPSKASQKEYLNQFSVEVYEEIGLDINKEYIRLRKFKGYIKLLLFYVYTFRLRASFHHYEEQVHQMRLAVLRAAAQRVYCAIKCSLFWRAVQRREELKRNQANREADNERAFQLLVAQCANKIRNGVRKYTAMKVVRRMLGKRRAATLIQKRARGIQGRRKAHAVLLMFQYIFRNATVIQCAARKRLAVRRVTLYRKLNFVKNWLAHVQQRKLASQEGLFLAGAEAFIARAYRTHVIRGKLKKLVHWNHFAKAITMQRVLRGYLTRRVTTKALKAMRVRRKLELLSALIIQRFVRGLRARLRYRKLVTKKKEMRKLKLEAKMKRLRHVNVGKLTPWMLLGALLYKAKPFKHIRLNKKATKIQRVWRGHHGRNRAFIVRIQQAIAKINRRYRLHTRSATKIQKVFRGNDRKKHRAARFIVRIQSIWRLHKSCRRVIRLKKLNKDAGVLTRLLFRAIKRHKFRVKFQRLQRLKKFVIAIQCFARRFLSKLKVYRVKTRLRSEGERNDFLTSRENDLASTVQLRVLVDTMTRTIGQRYGPQCFSSTECPCFGPVQAIFVLAACGKGKSDALLLGTNKVDAISMSKFVHRIQDLMVDGTETNARLKTLRRTKSVTTIHTLLKNQFDLALLDQIDRGHWVLPEGRTKLNSTEVDLLFGKSVTDHAAGNVLPYADFLECIYKIANVHYADRNLSLSASMLLMGEADDQVYDPNAVLPPLPQEGQQRSRPGSPGTVPGIAAPRSTMRSTVRVVRGRKTMTSGQLRYDPQELLSGPSVDFRLVLVLNMLQSFRDEPWLQPVLVWLDLESKARIGVFVIRMQNMVRIRQARAVKGLLMEKRAAKIELQRLSRFAVRIQAVMRRYVYRNRVAHMAQRMIFEYIPHLGEPYWYNPKTLAKSWIKPKVLRHLECFSIAMPEEGLENVISCCYCSKTAEVNCVQCEDSMCKVCYNSMHCKGNRRQHSSQKIPMCSFCKFQVATKSCLTCVLAVPSKSSMKYNMKQSDRGTYCDTCFSHEHDLNERVLEGHASRKKGIKIMLNYSHEAYLVKQYIHQRILTNHKYDQLVQPCEECRCRSSSWRCIDCQQVYCSKCLVGLHSMGGPFGRHTAELLPYYTTDMHVSLQKDFNAQFVQRKLEKLNRVAATQRDERQYHSAIAIQAWYRMIFYGRLGRRKMKKVRKIQRIAFAARKRDQSLRNSVPYRVANVFACAPALRTDTREETALRKVNIFRRQLAREYIWKNMDDWGHYRVSSSKPRKGVPRRGFATGSVEELIDQAQNGGYRMPGRVMVRPGERLLETSCDLTKHLKPGELVRICNRLFGVIKVSSDSVKLNRNWRGVEPADGEVMYRVPTYRNEPDRLSFRLRYTAYSLTVANPISQAYFHTHRWYYRRWVQYAVGVAVLCKKNKQFDDLAEWKVFIDACNEQVTWAGSFLSNTDAMVDLSTIEMPNEDEMAGERRRSRRERRGGDEDGYNSLSDEDEGSDMGDMRPSSGDRQKPSSRQSRRSGRSVHVGDGMEMEDEDGNEYESDDFQQEGEQKGGESKEPRRGGRRGSNDVDGFSSERPMSRESGRPMSRGQTPEQGGSAKLSKRTKKKKLTDSGRPPGVQWYATVEETMARREREDKMSNQELALEAVEWKECVDIMTENIYYLNVLSNEMMTTAPRSVVAKRQLEFENSKNKKNYDEAQRRIQRFELTTKNRLLITGGRKK
eukprot:gene24183-30498_t